MFARHRGCVDRALNSGSINMFSSSLKGKDKHMSGKIHEWLKLMAVRYKEKKKRGSCLLVRGRVRCGKIQGFGKLMAVRYKEKEVAVYLYMEVECDKCNMGFENEALNVRHQSLHVPFNVPSVIFSILFLLGHRFSLCITAL